MLCAKLLGQPRRVSLVPGEWQGHECKAVTELAEGSRDIECREVPRAIGSLEIKEDTYVWIVWVAFSVADSQQQ